MNRYTFLLVLSLTGISGSLLYAGEPAERPKREVVFARDIQPLLAKKCLICHGPDKDEGGLRLDIAEQAYSKLESGARAIVPGKHDASELLKRVTSTDESERMPPEGEPLTAEQISTLQQWILDGAKYEKHWAYRLVTEPAVPTVKNESWVRNSIDRYVLARLERAGITPSQEADRAILIKRLYYDLIGLPPTPSEVDAFVQDNATGAYESLVDRLMASQHFGERWGRHWLDKARYADSDGYEKDRPRPNAWRYRDWVIDAINSDMPFDQFTVEQLAGDLSPDASPLQKLATAFHRQTLTNTEGGTDQEQFRVEATFDRTETTASVWLALTFTCARCHSHKYDQIMQREYYQLFAFFNNVNEVNTDVAQSDEALAAYREQKAVHDAKVADLTERFEAAKQTIQPRIDAWAKEMTAKLAAVSSPLKFNPVKLVEVKSAGEAKLVTQQDGSLLVTGPVADIDKYTLIVEAPQQPLTGVRLEVLADDTLAGKGPGRAPNGNFVLSEIRAFVSADPTFKKRTTIKFTSAEADFSQSKFPPASAIVAKEKSGWAISPQMGKNHQITSYTKQPIALGDKKFLQIVLDQQYGGQHTIGRFRVSTISGFDPLRSLPKQLASILRKQPGDRSVNERLLIADHVASLESETAKLANELAELKKNAPATSKMSVRVIAPATRKTRILHRGDFLQPSDEVSSGVFDVVSSVHPFHPRNKDQPADRLDLANWLVDANHPLTSRVTVNQVWAHLFGRGLVATLNDFGVRGERPTHPELLDWLAWNFPRDLAWSRKKLIKTIVMSATYRQSSRHRPELAQVDVTNQLLARQNRLRVEAEIVRDLYLAASGLLTKKVGGPNVFPPLPAGVAELSYANSFKWKTSQGDDRYRRGMYTFFKRTSPHPNLLSFDCPDSNTTRLERATSNTPLQALVTLNNEVFTESAQAMVRRALTEGGDSDTERLTYAIRLCIARQPDSQEVARFSKLLQVARSYYAENAADATLLTNRHAVKDIPPAENAAWVATLRIVMNLDEFIVRE